MVVCKFFLQGTCKFGSMCKFDHDVKENYNPYQSTGTSILRSTNFCATPIPQPKLVPQEKQSVDTNMLIKSVVTDMTQAEKGGQWLFSCYAPFKEKPAFPGFEDQSFEELRHGYYEAAKVGSVEQFKQQIQNMVQEIILKVRSLQNPSPDIISMLINIYNSPASPQAGVYTGNTQTQSTSNFSFKSGGISQQSTSIFGQANQNIFGNTQQQQQQQQQQQNLFSPPTNNVFAGNNQTSQNIFGNQQGANFGNVSAMQQIQSNNSNIFAQGSNNLGIQNNSVFTSQPSAMPVNSNAIFNNNAQQANTTSVNSGSIFGNNSQPSNANVFAPQIQQNIFQPVSQTPNLFGPANNSVKPPIPITQTGSLFSTVQNNQLLQPQNNQLIQPQNNQFLQPQQNQVTQPSIFSQPSNSVMVSNNETPQSHNNNIFSNAQNTSALSNTGRNIDLSLYSKLEDLTEEEIKWFQSDDLDIMNIPEKPPTYEMCFNS